MFINTDGYGIIQRKRGRRIGEIVELFYRFSVCFGKYSFDLLRIYRLPLAFDDSRA